jgi:hypothetical protein
LNVGQAGFMANFDMHKRTTKRKSKKQQNREKRDFAETAFAVFQQATSGERLTRRQKVATGAKVKSQRHSRSGRGI